MPQNNTNPQSVEKTLYNGFGIKVIHGYKNHGANGGGLLLHYIDRHEEERTVAVEYAVISQPMKLFTLLSDALYPTPSLPQERTVLRELLNDVRPRFVVTYTQTTGWFGSCYVFGTRTIGPKDEANKFCLHPDVIGQMPEVQSMGSLDDWIEFVATPAVGNSRMMFALAVAFSAAILDLTGAESKIFNFAGEGRTGKSTILEAAASTVGGTGKTEGGIFKWNGSLSGMLALAALHNERPLFLDELSLIDPKVRGDIVHAMVEGRGKTRATSSGALSMLDMRWRTMVLSTSNDTPDDYGMIALGKTRDAQLARVLDIPALPAGQSGVFENIPEKIDGREIVTGQAFSEHLKEASRTYYGTALPKFIRHVSEELENNRSRLVTNLKDWIDEFVASTAHAGSNNMFRNAAKAFGHIYAAGRLAIAYEILPFTADKMLWAVQTCFYDHVQFRQAQELKAPQERRFSIHWAMRMLHTFIVDNRERFIFYHKKGQETTNQQYAESLGFFGNSNGGQYFWIKPQVLHETVFKNIPRRQQMEFLDEAGVLKRGNGSRAIIQTQFGPNIPRAHLCIDFNQLKDFLDNTT